MCTAVTATAAVFGVVPAVPAPATAVQLNPLAKLMPVVPFSGKYFDVDAGTMTMRSGTVVPGVAIVASYSFTNVAAAAALFT